MNLGFILDRVEHLLVDPLRSRLRALEKEVLPSIDSDRRVRWDLDFLALAAFWTTLKSKDPSTKCGAIVVDGLNRVVGMGYNGFPRGVDDSPERYADRPTKYKLVAHAEPNAILDAGRQAFGSTLYVWPLPSCNECAKMVIQSGVKRIVSPEAAPERWGESMKLAEMMYKEAGVEMTLYPQNLIAERLDHGYQSIRHSGGGS